MTSPATAPATSPGWWLQRRAFASVDGGDEHVGAGRGEVAEIRTRITAVTVEARHGDVRATLDEFASLIDRFRRSGAWTRLMVVVWNLIEALDELGAAHPAAVLLHAAPGGAPAPYGDQLARLEHVRNRIADTMPADALGRAVVAGSALSRKETAEFALTALAQLVPA